MSDPMPDAVVLVGGMGTRLRSVVADRPKPLAPVAGRPFLSWLLIHLAQQGVRRAVLSAGYQAEQIEAFAAEENEQMELELPVVTEPFPLGTGGALRLALAKVRTAEVLVLNGDSFCGVDLAILIQAQRKYLARAVLTLTEVADASRFGSVAIDAGGAIRAFREKVDAGGRGLINAGIYLVQRGRAAAIPADRVVSLERDVFPGWIGGGLFGVVTQGPFVDIGTPESYAWANAQLDWPSLTGSPSAPDET